MSFFGGGTDYPDYFNKYGGAVLSSTFDKYCYVTVRHVPRFFDYTNQIKYSTIEQTQSVDEIRHPAVREAMKFLDMREIQLNYDADLPARSGLGTSSAFAVGMLNAFYALKGKYADKRKLADDAIYLERVLCKEDGGVQDQIAASFGGFNRINFSESGYTVHPVVISEDRKAMLNDRLALFFTGFSRFSSEVAKEQEKSIEANLKRLDEMKGLVDSAERILTSKTNLDEFGKLLDYTWKLKRGLTSKISTDSIDEVYKAAMDAGALGGKLLGAGGGGFLLFYVDPERRPKLKRALKDFLYVPFKFESEGTSILYYKAEYYDINS